MFDRLFLKHPRSIGETYFQHAGVALSVSGWCFLAACAALVHAAVPALFQRTGSRIIIRLNARVTGRSAPTREELDYAI
jgi:hypothetical protein